MRHIRQETSFTAAESCEVRCVGRWSDPNRITEIELDAAADSPQAPPLEVERAMDVRRREADEHEGDAAGPPTGNHVGAGSESQSSILPRPRLNRDDMLASFRSVRQARSTQAEADLVIQAILDRPRRPSLPEDLARCSHPLPRAAPDA